ncbi:MAG TPA: transposase [Thermotogota bacterium]|nr:transposase [Thermotogota bacterium]HRW94054.1 transposase [Thermotogota bacterium]
MFRQNQAHLQQNLFSLERRFPQKVVQRLHNTIYPLFYEMVFCRIDESLFEGMYSQDQASRPNCPVNVLVGMELLKALLDLSDVQLLESMDLDLRFRVALGLSTLEEETPCDRTLYNFRKRLRMYLHQEEGKPLQGLFDDLTRAFLDKAKLKTDMIRMDSTQISSKMRSMSRAELMIQAMAKVIRELRSEEKKALPEAYAPFATAEGIRTTLGNLRWSKETLQHIADMMKELLERFEHTPVAQTPSYVLMQRIFADQTISIAQQAVVKEGKQIEPSACQSTVDPDATYTRKGKKAYQGYSANFSETANPENEVQMLTSVDVQPNTHSDRRYFQESLSPLKEKKGMDTLIVDGGYGGQDSANAAQSEGVTLVETAIKGKVPLKHTEEFVLNAQGIESCPMGYQPTQTRIHKEQVQALFSSSDCAGCNYAECPAKKVAKGMKVSFSLEKHQKDKRRAAMKQVSYKQVARLRAAIEGKISALKRCGLNRLQIVRLTRVQMVVTYSAIVSNLKQLFRLMSGRTRKRPKELLGCAA